MPWCPLRASITQIQLWIEIYRKYVPFAFLNPLVTECSTALCAGCVLEMIYLLSAMTVTALV